MPHALPQRQLACELLVIGDVRVGDGGAVWAELDAEAQAGMEAPQVVFLLVGADDNRVVLPAGRRPFQVPDGAGGVEPEDRTEGLVSSMLAAGDMRQGQRPDSELAKRSEITKCHFSVFR